MKPEAELYERIERYLNDQMEPEERSSFEQAMKEDSSLEREVKLVQEMAIQLGDGAWQSLSIDRQSEDFQAYKNYFSSEEAQKLRQNILAAKPAKAASQVRQLYRRMAMVAAIAMLLLAGYWIIKPFDTGLNTDDYFSIPAFEVSTKSDTASLIQLIEKAYKARDYQQALPLLQVYLQDHPNDFLATRAAGYCMLELDQYNAAREMFNRLAGLEDVRHQDGDWYLVLVEINAGDMDAARKRAMDIQANPRHRYQQLAADLLKKLP